MKEQMSGEIYKGYKERRSWARGVAHRLGVKLSEGEEFFEVPIYDDAGKEMRVEHIPTGMDVPIADESGRVLYTIPSDEAVEAIQKYPDDPLPEAIRKLAVSKTIKEMGEPRKKEGGKKQKDA